MLSRDAIRVVIVVADIASLLILAFIVLKTYLFSYNCFNTVELFLTVIPLATIKVGEILLGKYG